MKKKMYIMVVDDDEAIRALLRRALELAGYSVALASDGNSALSLMEERKPDLVLLDIIMPGISGLEVLYHVRKHSTVPVIVLTAKQEATTAKTALLLGADDYVRKPFSIQELLARVKAKLRRAEAGAWRTISDISDQPLVRM